MIQVHPTLNILLSCLSNVTTPSNVHHQQIERQKSPGSSMDPHWSMARRCFPGNVMHGSNRAVICTFAAFFQAATPLELPPVATDFPWFWQNLSCNPCPLPEPSLSQNQRWHHCPSDWIFLSIPQQDIKDKSVIDCSMKIYEFGNRSLIYNIKRHFG